jgi:hypothetical protein
LLDETDRITTPTLRTNSHDAPLEELKQTFSSINGILFPGGGSNLDNTTLYQAGQYLYDLTLNVYSTSQCITNRTLTDSLTHSFMTTTCWFGWFTGQCQWRLLCVVWSLHGIRVAFDDYQPELQHLEPCRCREHYHAIELYIIGIEQPHVQQCSKTYLPVCQCVGVSVCLSTKLIAVVLLLGRGDQHSCNRASDHEQPPMGPIAFELCSQPEPGQLLQPIVVGQRS